MEEEKSTDQPEMQEATTEAVEERSMAALMLTDQRALPFSGLPSSAHLSIVMQE
jgi:hypothetical protein